MATSMKATEASLLMRAVVMERRRVRTIARAYVMMSTVEDFQCVTANLYNKMLKLTSLAFLELPRWKPALVNISWNRDYIFNATFLNFMPQHRPI